MDIESLKGPLFAAADAVSFLLTRPAGWAILGGILALGFALRASGALRDRFLACEASGRRMGAGQAFGVLLRELYGSLAGAVAVLPTVAVVLVGSVLLVGVSDSVRRLDEIAENRARISELSAVVRNLERRYRVADVRVLSADGRTARLALAFYDSRTPGKPVRTQEAAIEGSEVFVDALVLDFAYSEIESGRRVNLALPYRVYGNLQAPAEGQELALLDERGVPLLYRRAEAEIYGIDPEAYDARLEELMGLLEDERARRRAGVVRSLFGAAVRRRVRAGDAFTIWIEQTGGLTIKGDGGF